MISIIFLHLWSRKNAQKARTYDNAHNPGCLGYIGDSTSQSYGDYNKKHCQDPSVAKSCFHFLMLCDINLSEVTAESCSSCWNFGRLSGRVEDAKDARGACVPPFFCHHQGVRSQGLCKGQPHRQHGEKSRVLVTGTWVTTMWETCIFK